MNTPGGEQLRVKPGQRIRAFFHNGLVDFAQRLSFQRGSVPGRSEPGGFTPMIEATATISTNNDFRISVEQGNEVDELRVTFSPGHVSGVVPTIDGVALDDVDLGGNPPALIVTADAWRLYGRGERALLMFRYELGRDFRVEKVVPVAVPKPPAAAPWLWHKLAAILIRREGSVRCFPMIFFSQQFNVAGAKPATGGFQALPSVA